MPKAKMFSIAPEDKRSVAVTLKLTEHENELLTKYAAQLDSDKSYVAGKIIEAFVPQALAAKVPAEQPATNVNGSGKKHWERPPAPTNAQ